MDLIDRQALLTELDRYIDAHRGYGFENVRVILRGLKREIIDFPCAQPEKRTDKRTGTHACDCISRQAVIAEFSCCELTPDGGIDANYAIDFLEQLPPAQPHITHCAECIHWKHSDVRKNYCEVFDWTNTAEDFCSFAERRTDE